MLRDAQHLFHQGHADEAASRLRSLLMAAPDDVATLCSLAVVEAGRGAVAAALPLLDRALTLDPRLAAAHRTRAGVLQSLGRPDEAVAAYEQALRLQPDMAEAASNLGGLLASLGRHQAALPWLRQAIAHRPDLAEAHNNLGVSHLALDQGETALGHFERALALRPDFADALGNRGAALIALGRIEAAAAAFEQAIRLAPDSGQLYLDLVSCRTLSADDPSLAAMRRLAAQPGGVSGASRIALHFALGKALDGLGDTETAFRHWRQGNALQRIGVGYDEKAVLATMRTVAHRFDAEFVQQRDQAGFDDETPVFVVGMPRSGTTLIEQILASHPLVFGAGERTELHDAARAALGKAAPPATLFDRLGSLTPDQLQPIGAQYAATMRRLAPEAARIVDKLPANFLLLGLIARVLPRARIVHVVRDPLDTCFSCFTTLFSGDQRYAYNLGELGRYWRAYAGLMQHWRAVLPEGRMLEVRYEDVVADLEGGARRMVAFCGLDWDARCLTFQHTVRSVQTASRVQVRQGLYRSSVGRARRYWALLDPLRAALGEPTP